MVDALLALNIPLRALVRDPSSQSAQHLGSRGVTLFKGDFGALDSISAAARGASGLFSVQVSGAGEVGAAQNVVTAAQRAGITTLVHTSGVRAGEHEQFDRWSTGRWPEDYWRAKADANAAVRDSGVEHWVILKPAFLMENFAKPEVTHMFPTLSNGTLDTAYDKHTRLDLIAAADVGTFRRRGFYRP